MTALVTTGQQYRDVIAASNVVDTVARTIGESELGHASMIKVELWSHRAALLILIRRMQLPQSHVPRSVGVSQLSDKFNIRADLNWRRALVLA